MMVGLPQHGLDTRASLSVYPLALQYSIQA
jgi:hypothetical protein